MLIIRLELQSYGKHITGAEYFLGHISIGNYIILNCRIITSRTSRTALKIKHKNTVVYLQK